MFDRKQAAFQLRVLLFQMLGSSRPSTLESNQRAADRKSWVQIYNKPFSSSTRKLFLSAARWIFTPIINLIFKFSDVSHVCRRCVDFWFFFLKSCWMNFPECFVVKALSHYTTFANLSNIFMSIMPIKVTYLISLLELHNVHRKEASCLFLFHLQRRGCLVWQGL